MPNTTPSTGSSFLKLLSTLPDSPADEHGRNTIRAVHHSVSTASAEKIAALTKSASFRSDSRNVSPDTKKRLHQRRSKRVNVKSTFSKLQYRNREPDNAEKKRRASLEHKTLTGAELENAKIKEKSNRTEENSSRGGGLYNRQNAVFSEMSLTEMKSHLSVIQSIEKVLIVAITSLPTVKISGTHVPDNLVDGNLQERITKLLNSEHIETLQSLLTDWKALPPEGIDIPIRDQLIDILKTGEINQLRKLFPIQESGGFVARDSGKKADSEYTGTLSKKLQHIIKMREGH